MAKAGREDEPLYLGIEIGGTKLQIFAGDSSGRILERQRFDVDTARGARGIRSQLQKSLPSLVRRIRPRAVGIGFGGPVDWKTGKICRSHQIEGWSGFSLGKWCSDLADAPVLVENDANLGAFGEAIRGAGRGFESVFYVTLGSGVGGGFVQGGKIHHGAPPGEAEIGHLRLDKTGVILEERCSGWSVNKKIRAAVLKKPQGALARIVGEHQVHEAKFLAPALKAGDRQAGQILAETADDLAFGLSHATHLFHPHVIVLGGGLSLIGEPFRAAVAGALPGYLMKVFAGGPKIVLSELGADAVPVGALCLAKTA